MSNLLNVHIGEVKTGREGDVLQALLGSCVGIGFLYKERGIFGLAHCLLSESPDKNFAIGGRYVDQAIFSLLTLMKIEQNEVRNIHAVIAGGGNMTKSGDADPKKLVGAINSSFTKKQLRKRRIKILHEDFGGMLGRKIIIDCAKGEYQIKHIPRLEVA